MPAGNIPQRERRFAPTYLVEFAKELGVVNMYSSSSSKPKPKKGRGNAKKAEPALPKATREKKLAQKKKQKAPARAVQKKTEPVKKQVRPAKKQVVKKRAATVKKQTTRASKRCANPTLAHPKRPSKQQPVKAVKTQPAQQVPQVESKQLGTQPSNASLGPSTSNPAPPVLPLSITIATLTGKRFEVPFAIENSMTVHDLCSHIERTQGIPAAMQRLIFAGRSLDEAEKRLWEYGVAPGRIVHLLLRLRAM